MTRRFRADRVPRAVSSENKGDADFTVFFGVNVLKNRVLR